MLSAKLLNVSKTVAILSNIAGLYLLILFGNSSFVLNEVLVESCAMIV
ncbi:hypothetical protein [Rickettsia endosymbiont of Urophora cardui]